MKKKYTGDHLEAMKTPLFSIITPCLNRAEFIVEAVESVLAQNYQNFEHIIIDGGSTDGTLEILRRYPHLRIVSESDKGMYDAINKGLELARGDVIGLLNSDDLYEANQFNGVAKEFVNESVQSVVGRAMVFITHPDGFAEIVGNFSPKSASLLELSTMGSPFFNAWFFRKSVFEKIGVFNTSYSIVADRDFMLRFALAGLKYEVLDASIYQYRQHASSMTFDITDQKLQRIIDEHIIMTGAYLEQKSLPIEARNLIRKLRTRDTLEMAVRSLKKMNFPKFAYYSWRGIEYGPLWFQNFTRRVIHKEPL